MTSSNSRVSSTGRSSHGRTCSWGSPWASSSLRMSLRSVNTRFYSKRPLPRFSKERCLRRSSIRVRYGIAGNQVMTSPLIQEKLHFRHTVARRPSSVSFLAYTVKFKISLSSTVMSFPSSGVSVAWCWHGTFPVNSKARFRRLWFSSSVSTS